MKGKSERRVRKVAEEHIVVCERQSEMLTGERAWMRRNVAGEKMRNDVWVLGGAGRGPKVDVVANKNEDEQRQL